MNIYIARFGVMTTPKIGTSLQQVKVLPVLDVWVLAVYTSLNNHQHITFPTIRTMVCYMGVGVLYHMLFQNMQLCVSKCLTPSVS